jgi:hypothetical protein
VEDPEVDPAVKARPLALAVLALVVLALGAAGPAAAAATAAPFAAGSTPPVTGAVTGPALVAAGGNATFFLNASGGPAEVAGVLTGSISWNASLLGPNTTGTSVAPTSGTITNGTSQPVRLTVTAANVLETVRLSVKLTSTGSSANSTTNLSTSFRIVTPYVVWATLVAGPNAAVLPFNVTVALDGTVVGTVAVPGLAPNATYDLVYRYASPGLSSGYHTFTLSMADPHGLVTFASGLTVQSTTFYVSPPATSDTLWFVVGAVAFLGVLFIYATRVAARRQGSARR